MSLFFLKAGKAVMDTHPITPRKVGPFIPRTNDGGLLGRKVKNCSHEHMHGRADRVLRVLEEKWTIQLLHHLVQEDNRFGQLQRAMKGSSPNRRWCNEES